jgi:hypothetical protein
VGAENHPKFLGSAGTVKEAKRRIGTTSCCSANDNGVESNSQRLSENTHRQSRVETGRIINTAVHR